MGTQRRPGGGTVGLLGKLAAAIAAGAIVAAPVTAWAADPPPDAGRSGESRDRHQPDDGGRSGTAPDNGDAGSGSDARDKGAKPDDGTRRGGDTTTKTAPPQSNRGTIKIDGVPIDGSKGNEPHVGCVFALRFENFPAGKTGTVTFTAHAPTGSGVLLSETRAFTGSVTYDLRDELAGMPRHPKQGWHVKVSADGKHKVFWIDCPADDAAVSAAGAAVSAAGSMSSTTTATDDGRVAAAGGPAVVDPSGAARAAGAPAEVKGTQFEAASETGGSSGGPTRVLARTGLALALLAAIGAALTGLGYTFKRFGH